MKSIVLSFSILILSLSLKAQTEQLLIKNSGKGSYVEHKVTAKENFYSIGRLFNVHPKHLALFNSLDMSKGLSLGQTVKIPLSDTNFSRKSEIGTPVYYITGSNETIYNISTNNGVLMEKLRKWNQISNDNLPRGSKLIVGFLMNGQSQALAANNTQKVDTVNKISRDPVKDVAKNEIANKPGTKKEEVKQKEEPKKDNSVIPARKEVKQEKEEPKKNNDVVQAKEEMKKPLLEQGFFKSSFDQQIKHQPITKEQTVTSGIFKTSSGWSDAKFYLLMDGADPGTIVKITNPTNNKMIYAKLLGEMTNLKQNLGLNIRISNAAAAALDISETDKFIVKLNY